ncbi:MAG: hypothetical protein P9L92_06320 [Candidatus Electryonea clarkiae]|nr:hypothetical protein [Candidatus Electryonea clarkiae]MDP8287707.1 hypothetical protein [Candidatus Electryonea clarkiae]
MNRYLLQFLSACSGLLLLWFSPTNGQLLKIPKLNELVADTLVIQLDSTVHADLDNPKVSVIDNRSIPGTVMTIDQIKKLRFIPVDRYMVLDKPLDQTISERWNLDNRQTDFSLNIDKISIWYDRDLIFRKVMVLNGYSRLENGVGKTLKEWQWEYRKRFKAKKAASIAGGVISDWMDGQYAALQGDIPTIPIEPHLYKRQCQVWTDNILLRDGFIIDTRLSLNYPIDQLDTYYRKISSLYYRKSSKHESIAFGGRDLHWYKRLNSLFIARINGTARIGFNNFEKDKFDHVDFINILLLNASGTAVIEYRPPFHKWFYAGFGIHQSYNFLPTVIDQMDTGIVLTLGAVFP